MIFALSAGSLDGGSRSNPLLTDGNYPVSCFPKAVLTVSAHSNFFMVAIVNLSPRRQIERNDSGAIQEASNLA